jgi:hypothetical protein
MRKKDENLERVEAFVREALSQTSRGRVKESTVKYVARKVSKAIPSPRKKEERAALHT